MNSRLARLLANPQLNGWGFIIGIIGLLFAFYTYWNSQNYPNLMAQVHPSRTILVSSEGAQDLSIYANGKLIKGPVTSAQISIWNAGTKPIKAEDILEKIQIKNSMNTPLLSVRMLKTTREVSKFKTDMSEASLGVLGIGFQILEKGDGALIQLTYEGDEKVTFTGSGVIVGQNAFEITSLKNAKDSSQQQTNYNSWARKIGGVAFVTFLATIIFILSWGLLGPEGIRKEFIKHNSVLGKIIVLVQAIIITAMLLTAGYFIYNIFQEITKNYSPFLA